jgi:type III pantothenate kinase
MPGARNPAAQTGNSRLAVDIGNTHTVAGWFHGGKIRRRWRLPTRRDATVDEIAFWLRGLIAKKSSPAPAAALASVVPVLDDVWLAALEEVFRVQPRMLNYRDCLGLKLDYEIPSQIGADRLANVLGAQALGIAEGVIIDFGTATTFDVFADHAYHGGVICPGLQTGLRALTQSAAKLAEPELRWPEGAVGRNTGDALRIGILHGAVGMIESLLKDILRESAFNRRKPPVLATGGLAVWMKGRTAVIDRFEPDLTLLGINHLLSGKAPDGVRRRRTT